MKKDFLIYSVYGYFEKSLEVLDKQLAMYGVTVEQRKEIIPKIRERAHWNKEQISSIYDIELKNHEYLFIYNADITKGVANLGTMVFPINDVIEKYLEEKQAKEVIEKLLADMVNSNYAVDDNIKNNFCIYQHLEIPIEGYGVISKDFSDYMDFIKDYLGYTISHEK